MLKIGDEVFIKVKIDSVEKFEKLPGENCVYTAMLNDVKIWFWDHNIILKEDDFDLEIKISDLAKAIGVNYTTVFRWKRLWKITPLNKGKNSSQIYSVSEIHELFKNDIILNKYLVAFEKNVIKGSIGLNVSSSVLNKIKEPLNDEKDS